MILTSFKKWGQMPCGLVLAVADILSVSWFDSKSIVLRLRSREAKTRRQLSWLIYCHKSLLLYICI